MVQAGDPTAYGWVVTLGYGVCACCCAAAARRRPPESPRAIRVFWCVLAVGLLGLGVNKQLDFQTGLREELRRLIGDHGLYGYREWFLLAGFGFVASAGAAISAFAVYSLWPYTYRLRLALVGLATWGVYLIMRVSVMLHIPRFLGMRDVPIDTSHPVELAGLACIAVAALHDRKGP